MINTLIKRLNSLPQWLILAIVATLPRIITLGRESLWFDESFTWLVAAPKTDFWRAVLGDDHPPLWSMLQWVNIRLFGGSEFAYRFPSMLFSVGTVILIYYLALNLTYDKRVAFWSGLLTSLLPGLLYFGQDGRMYAALAFFVLLLFWGVIEYRPLIVFIAGLGAVYTQNVGVLYVFSIGVMTILMFVQRFCRYIYRMDAKTRIMIFEALIRAIWPYALIALCYVAWIPTLQKQTAMVNASFWMPPITTTNVLWPFYYGTLGDRVPDILQMHEYILLTILLVIGLWVSRKWLREYHGLLYGTMMLGAPILLSIYAIVTGRNIFVYRPVLASVMLLTILMAYALCHLRLEYRKIAVRLVILVLVVDLGFYYTYNTRLNIPEWLYPITGQNAPANPIAYPTHFQSGDAIWFTDGTPAILFGHYLTQYPVYLRPYHGDVMSITDEDRAAFNAYLPTATLDQLKRRGYRHVYWIVIRNPFTEQQEVDSIESTIKNYHPETIWEQQTSKTSYNFIYRIDF